VFRHDHGIDHPDIANDPAGFVKNYGNFALIHRPADEDREIA
jgi:hypothetical protein